MGERRLRAVKYNTTMSERLGPGWEAAPQPPGKLLEYLASRMDQPCQPGFFQAAHECPMGAIWLTAYGDPAVERTVLLKAYGRQSDAGKLIAYGQEDGVMVAIAYSSASSPGDELKVQVGDDSEPPADPLRDAQLVTVLFDSFMAEQTETVEAA